MSKALTQAKAWNLTPTSLGEAMKFGEMLAGSGLVPEVYKNNPAGVVAACEQGSHLGFTAMQSLQSIAVINGLPSLWGDALPALAMGHPKFVSIDETFDDDTMTASCTVEREGMKPQTRKFSWSDAERAGLTGKDTYKKYPQRMLKARARAWAIRDVFPDALKGCQVVEEVRDYPSNAATDEDYRNVVADVEPESIRRHEATGEETGPEDGPKTGMDALGEVVDAATQPTEAPPEPEGDQIEDADVVEDEPFSIDEAKLLDWKQTMDEATDEAELEKVGLELNGMDDGPFKTMLRSYYETRLRQLRKAAQTA